MQPEGAPTVAATNTGGGFWDGANSFLGNALKMWGDYEKVKAVKSSNGITQKEHMNTAELDNGAAVLVDAPKTQTAQPREPMVFGLPQKTVLYGFGGLLVVALVMKAMK